MNDRLKNISPPIEFSGASQLLLYTRYGDPRKKGWDKKWITEWHVHVNFPWFPTDNILIHKHFRPILEQAFEALELAGVHQEIKTFNGGFDVRNIRGSKAVLSVHSWGAAIDLNAKQNPLGSMGTWSDKFIRTMVRNEIYCGQKWKDRKDPMHFSMVNG
jgi:hypothetical protein